MSRVGLIRDGEGRLAEDMESSIPGCLVYPGRVERSKSHLSSETWERRLYGG